MGVKVSQPNEDRILLESNISSDVTAVVRSAQDGKSFELIWGSTLPEAFPNALDAVHEGMRRIDSYDDAVRAREAKRLDTRDQLREAVEIIHLQEANSGVSNS